MIHFEVGGKGFAIAATELAGVANACPFTTYPGLPDGVSGIIQWSGKIFPVLQAGPVDFKTCTFLISTENLKGPFTEIALAVPGPVKVFIAQEKLDPPKESPPGAVGLVKDREGCEAYVMSLAEVARILTMGETKGGRLAA